MPELIGEFIYCSRCRVIVRLEQAITCPQTGRWMCTGCTDKKVSA
jgi:hypothetical protein